MASDALKKLTRTMPPEGSEDTLHDMEHAESDRGAALLGCSTVEFALQFFLKKHMIAITPAEEGALFMNNGPLSDLGGRISVAYSFGLIDANFRDDLLNLKDIRNAFGHAPQRVSFEIDAIKARCARFHSLKIMSEMPKEPRKQFITSAKIMFGALKLTGAAQELPLPLGMPGTIWAVAASKETKTIPGPRVSLEQLVRDLERGRSGAKKSETSSDQEAAAAESEDAAKDREAGEGSQR